MPYGVTPQMLEVWGEAIFALSLNVQTRRGDPVRALDRGAWLAQRDATGLSDVEIAARVGLAAPQVTYIRNVLERRKFRIDQYRKLFRLGGGKRHREDEYRDPELSYRVRPEAMLVRAALRFDAECVSRWLRDGSWNAETLPGRVRAHLPKNIALRVDGKSLSYGELIERSEVFAAALAAQGVLRGDVVALATNDVQTFTIAYLGAATLGAAALVLDPKLALARRAASMHRARARAAVADGKEADALRKRVPSLGPVIAAGIAGEAKPLSSAPPVAADPLLIVDAGARNPCLAPFSHQNVLANARSLAARLKVGAKDRIAVDAPLHDPLGLAAVHLALATGAALVIGRGATPSIELASASAKRRKVPTAELRCLPETQAIAARGPRETELRLLDGVEKRRGVREETELRGPGIAPGYVDDPAATLKRFSDDGWFRGSARSMPRKPRRTR